MNVNVYFVGTAGSGKTYLTDAFKSWIEDHDYSCITVNLDPGAERLPYAPDVDVRDWISLPDVMRKYGVGPNGGQILCADLIALKVKSIKEEIDMYNVDYVLIDTPGQVELFAFRESSKLVVDSLGGGLMAFLYDPALSRTPSGFVSSRMLCASIQFRFMIPSCSLLSKSDLLKKDEIDRIVAWYRDFDELSDALSGKGNVVTIELFKALESIGSYGDLIPVSAKEGTGMEDLYNVIQQIFMGGEDIVK